MDNVNNMLNKINLPKIYLPKMDEYKKFMLFILVIFVLILLYLFYEYSFARRNFNKISKIQYIEKIKLEPLKPCYKIEDPLEEYILADYYIASSYKSALIGNQKYDYLSLDMIQKVLESGARYIELEICKGDVSIGALPVIASGDSNGDWISSINSLDSTEVFNTIAGNAFSNKEGRINYPLFIYLYLNTDDTETLNVLAQNIKTYLGKYLLNPKNYYKYPISLEKICRLLNKIVFFSSTGYEKSQLRDIVIPTGEFLNRIIYKDIELFGVNPKHNKKYNKILSRHEQELTKKRFMSKYPTFKDITYDINILEDLKNDDVIKDVLSYYNKIGMTVVVPHDEEEIFTLNYDPTYAFNYGCQFIALNYQNADNYMNKYIHIFSKSSFVLKPEGLRFHRNRKELPDMMSLYSVEEIPKPIPILSEFRTKFLNKMIVIESHINVGTYLTTRGENLLFTKNIRNDSIQEEDSNSKYNIEQCFIVKLSKNLSSGGVMFASAKNPTLYIVRQNKYYYLKFIGKDVSLINQATFIPIIPKCNDKDYVSFKTMNKTDNYLGNSNGNLIESEEGGSRQNSRTCFKVSSVPFKLQISFRHHSGKYLKSNNEGLVYVQGETETKQHKFDIIGNYIKEPVYLKNYNGKYLSYKDNRRVEIISETPTSVSKFRIERDENDNAYYNIMNLEDEYLTVQENSIIRMKKNKPLLKPEELDEDGEIAKLAKYGHSLGNAKKFKIRVSYIL